MARETKIKIDKKAIKKVYKDIDVDSLSEIELKTLQARINESIEQSSIFERMIEQGLAHIDPNADPNK